MTLGRRFLGFGGRGGGAMTVLLTGVLVASGCRETALGPDAPPGAKVVLGGANIWGDDHYVANSVALDGDRLSIEVSYGGGCREHTFTLVVSETFLESDPVQLPAVLAHDANGDSCEAWLTATHVFDLTLVRTHYRQAYGPGPGRVVPQIEGAPGHDLLYEFTG